MGFAYNILRPRKGRDTEMEEKWLARIIGLLARLGYFLVGSQANNGRTIHEFSDGYNPTFLFVRATHPRFSLGYNRTQVGYWFWVPDYEAPTQITKFLRAALVARKAQKSKAIHGKAFDMACEKMDRAFGFMDDFRA